MRARECWGTSILDGAVTEKVIFEKRPKEGEKMSHADNWGVQQGEHCRQREQQVQCPWHRSMTGQ